MTTTRRTPAAVGHDEGVPRPAIPRRFIRAELDGVPQFAGLAASGWEQLLSVARSESPADGECVQHAGQRMGRVVVVLAGGLRIVHVDADGRSRLVRLRGPGDHIGETELVLRHHPVHSAFAAPGTRLCVIPHAEFAALIAAHPSMLRAMLESAHQRLLATELQLASQVTDDVLTRLVAYLLGLPGTDDGGRRRVHLPSSQVDVASFLGTTPETLSRRIRRLVDSGVVDRLAARGGFALDVDRLAELLRTPDRTQD